MKFFKNYLFLSTFLVLLFSCSTDDSNLSEENGKSGFESSEYAVNSITKAINLHGLTIVGENSKSNDFKFFEVSSPDFELRKIFVDKKEENFLRIYTGSDIKRELIFNKSDQEISYLENGIGKNIDQSSIDDLLFIYMVEAGFTRPQIKAFQEECLHTSISIRWRRSISEENAQKTIDEYLADNPDCKKVADIDSICSGGDFGCVSVGEISCPNGNDCE